MSGWRHALSWFPGHVARAHRIMQERIRKVDIVIEVRDARAPRSSGSSQLSKLVGRSGRSQEHFIVVNKADLVSRQQHAVIKRWMAADHPNVPVHFTSARNAQGSTMGIDDLLAATVQRVRTASPRLFARQEGVEDQAAPLPSSNVARAISQAAAKAAGGAANHGSDDRSLPLIMMVVGVPNVGKSSLINAFRRVGVARARRAQGGADSRPRGRARTMKPARTGALPGVTTSLSGFQVCWSPSVWMLDTPGVLSPSVDGGWEAALRLGVLDLIKYKPESTEAVAAYALYHLANEDAGVLERWPRAAELAATQIRSVSSPSQSTFTSLNEGRSTTRSAGKDDDGAPCEEERFALRLLNAVAMDMGLWLRDGRLRKTIRSPHTRDAAQRVLRSVRCGELGSLCFDNRPPQLADMRWQARSM